MDCNKYEEMLSELLDNSLDGFHWLSLGLHLQKCVSCDSLRIDLIAIIKLGRELRMVPLAPPNADALWARLAQSLQPTRGVVPSCGERSENNSLRNLYVENEPQLSFSDDISAWPRQV